MSALSKRRLRRSGMLGGNPGALPRPAPTSAPAARPSVPPTSPTGRVEALAKLAALRDSGVLTEEQFAAERERLLGS
ncbi:MAG TPA: SHOCT domain-containing protein [Solirubrobacterales bacterium]|nr:SHOCT domain-containing protein [Solirubrobacterales bacterium]